MDSPTAHQRLMLELFEACTTLVADRTDRLLAVGEAMRHRGYPVETVHFCARATVEHTRRSQSYSQSALKCEGRFLMVGNPRLLSTLEVEQALLQTLRSSWVHAGPMPQATLTQEPSTDPLSIGAVRMLPLLERAVAQDAQATLSQDTPATPDRRSSRSPRL